MSAFSSHPLPPLPQNVSAASLLQQLASPTPSFIDNTLPSYLVNEMIRTLRLSTTARIKRKRKVQAEIRARDGLSGTATSLGNLSLRETDKERQGISEAKPMTEAEREKAEEDLDVLRALHESLHTIGLQVGGNIAEK
ncbi:hypothetical protein QFC19_007465 [Naganishia cerealis]|uniref:Uncharacterized protein n=1 Tax=Naganishia cerealis TaxID=610337 RepID=A0ACC2V8Z0_9TREE|nr:hypothetical protein QFC19_007465 [Naganishia cerealis]